MLLFIKYNHCHHHSFVIFRGHCYAIVLVLDWYWVLVSLVANIIGYWILGGMGAFLGIVLTLITLLLCVAL